MLAGESHKCTYAVRDAENAELLQGTLKLLQLPQVILIIKTLTAVG